MDREKLFTQVLEANRDRIYRLCCCYVRDPEARKDVFQEALVNIWRGLGGFEGKAAAGTWVYRVTVNSCLGFLRGERRRRAILDDGTDPAMVPDPGQGEEALVHDAELEHLYACIDRLKPVDRTIVSLYLEDVTTREMAEIVGLTEVNIRVRLHRVKETLRHMWGEEKPWN